SLSFHLAYLNAAEIIVKYYTLPILLGKNDNPTVRIGLYAHQSDIGKTLNSLKISLKESSDLNDIRTVSLYTSKADSSINPTLEKWHPISKVDIDNAEIELPLNLKIEQEGAQYFWLTLGVNEHADLLDKINLK